MAYTLYDSTITICQGLLGTFAHLLRQAEAQPHADTLLAARLIGDMYPLTDQVRCATQFCENIAARLTGRTAVTYEGTPATYAECHERIEKVLKTLGEADKNTVNETGDKVALTKLGPGVEAPMSAAMYVTVAALPNVYFHLTTAYGILRKEGVPLSKRDYYAGLFPKGFA